MIASTDFSSSAGAASHRLVTTRSARATLARAEARLDETLVQRFNGGDESAFIEIMSRYRERLFSVAFSLLRNRSDADEIAQDAFIRAHRGLARFRGDSSLATWLHRIALNLARNRYWYNHRRRQHLARSFDTAFSDENQATLASLVASNGPTPVQDAATNEFTALVAVCMERLAPGPREILRRRNTLNCSYAEIAQAFGLSIGTVKSRIARARESLRSLLAQACPDFGAAAAPGEWFDPIRRSGCVEAICA